MGVSSETTTKVVQTPPPKIKHLDGIRTAAAFYIMLWHCQAFGRTGIHTLNFVNRIALLGVDFFLVLSGFTSQITYGSKESWMKSWKEYGLYIVRRFGRIAPIWYISLAFGVAVYSFDNECQSFLCIRENYLNIAKYMTFTVSWFPFLHLKDGMLYDAFPNPPAWTVSALAFFWTVYPLMYLVTKRINNRFVLGAAALIMCVVSMAPYHVFFHPYHPHMTREQLDWFYMFPPSRICSFIVGVLIGRIYQTSLEPRTRICRVPFAGVLSDGLFAVLAYWVLTLPAREMEEFGYWAAAGTPIVASFVLASSCAASKPRSTPEQTREMTMLNWLKYKRSFVAQIFSHSIFVSSADWTVTIYLIHYPLGGLLGYIGDKLPISYWGQWQTLRAGTLIPAMMAAWAIGAFVDIYINQPWYRVLRSLTSPSAANAATTSTSAPARPRSYYVKDVKKGEGVFTSENDPLVASMDKSAAKSYTPMWAHQEERTPMIV
eukprot:Filipodium_phascolosomae@DN2438_c0_g1_i2.p1